jgi:hypothetical protein
MNAVVPVSITVTITETDTVVPSGQTFASLQVVATDPSGTPQTATATSTAPDTYQAKFTAVQPGAGSIAITALDILGATLGSVLTLPYTTTSGTPNTYPQATGIVVTSP